MKKIYNWLLIDLKRIGAIQIIFIILLVPLYIIFLSDYVNSQAINILISVAAIVSTCFLYLAFRESKMANELKRNEPLFENFKNEIAEIKAHSEECIFTENAITVLTDQINYSADSLKLFTYGSFLNEFLRLYTYLNSNVNYKYIINFFGDFKQAYIDNEKAQDIGSGLNTIYFALIRLSSYYSKTYLLYSDIDRSEIDTKHKIFLFEKLNDMDFDFKNLHKYFAENTEEGKLLKKFIWFDLSLGNVFTIVLVNEFTYIDSMYSRNQEIFDKYK
jgi:hypothetical protein